MRTLLVFTDINFGHSKSDFVVVMVVVAVVMVVVELVLTGQNLDGDIFYP